MELTREQTIEVLKRCICHGCDDCVLSNDADCGDILNESSLHYLTELTEKEPAPSANGTSPQKKSIYHYDSMETLVCQSLRIGALSAEMGAKADYKDGVFVVEPRVGDTND